MTPRIDDYFERIQVDRDPVHALREAHDSAEYAAMHTSRFSRKNIERIERAIAYLRQVMEETS